MSHRKPDQRGFSIDVVRRLRSAGHVAYWAGGCVRDVLMGIDPKDYDVATSARPEEVQKLFRRTLAVGASFGVIEVVGGRGLTVEVATFRTDGTYSDGRHPDSVVYSTPEEDALRRDFTINGMFFDPDEDHVLDYVGGQKDLERKIVRAIRNPVDRFDEDKLRMLRAVRFASRFQFAIEKTTHDAVAAMADQIHVVSPERILTELRVMFEHPRRAHAVELLRETGLFRPVLPELVDLLGTEAWRIAVAMLQEWRQIVPLALALAGFTISLTEQQAAQSIDALLMRLRSSNEDRETAAWLIHHRRSLPDVIHRMSKLKRLLAHPLGHLLVDLQEAIERVELGKDDVTRHVRGLLAEWGPSELNPAPLITGNDLIAIGYSPGPEFGDILEAVRDRQLDNELSTKHDAIEWIRTRWPGEL